MDTESFIYILKISLKYGTGCVSLAVCGWIAFRQYKNKVKFNYIFEQNKVEFDHSLELYKEHMISEFKDYVKYTNLNEIIKEALAPITNQINDLKKLLEKILDKK